MIIFIDAWKSAFIKKFIIIDISFSRWKEGINHLFVRLYVKYPNSILSDWSKNKTFDIVLSWSAKGFIRSIFQ